MYEQNARARLADLIAARETAAAKAEQAFAAIARLDGVGAATESLQAELAALDAKEAGAMSDWGRDPSAGEPPKPDLKTRARLTAELAASRASAEAARVASAPLHAEYAAERRRVGEIGAEIEAVTSDVAADELRPLVDSFVVAAAALDRLKVRIGAGCELALRQIEGRGVVSPFFAKLEKLNSDMKGALWSTPAPALSKAGESTADWRQFLADLAGNADATLADSTATN